LINCYAEDLVNATLARSATSAGPDVVQALTYSGWRGGIVIGGLLYQRSPALEKGRELCPTAETLLLGSSAARKCFGRNNVTPTWSLSIRQRRVSGDDSTGVIAYPDGMWRNRSVSRGYFFFTPGWICLASASKCDQSARLHQRLCKPGGLLLDSAWRTI
jgi:hypothetical protein